MLLIDARIFKFKNKTKINLKYSKQLHRDKSIIFFLFWVVPSSIFFYNKSFEAWKDRTKDLSTYEHFKFISTFSKVIESSLVPIIPRKNNVCIVSWMCICLSQGRRIQFSNSAVKSKSFWNSNATFEINLE